MRCIILRTYHGEKLDRHLRSDDGGARKGAGRRGSQAKESEIARVQYSLFAAAEDSGSSYEPSMQFNWGI